MDVPTPHLQARVNSPLVDKLARVGWAARGTVYLLLGWVALQLALGHSTGTQANQKGAFEELARQPAGSVLLAVVAAGLAAYAVFRLIDAIWGNRDEEGAKQAAKRVGSAGRAVAYAVLTYAAVAVLTHRSTSAGSGSGASLMHHSWGRWLVGAVGLGLLGGGAALAVSGVMRRFKKELRMGEMGPRTRQVVEVVGVIGITARGVAFALIGWFFIDAAVTYDPAKARGLDQSLRELLQHPAGKVLAILVAVGLVVFGAYAWCEARWRRTGREGAGGRDKSARPARPRPAVSAGQRHRPA